jgi:MFS family permease
MVLMSAISPGATRRDVQIIGLVSFAHGLSHFMQLALPTVFLAIRRDWDISFTALGLAATVFYVVSGVSQTIAGFAVDRVGARTVLFAGLGLLSAGVGLMGLAPNLEIILVCSAIAGVGNSMFHPADFGVLNATVAPRRLGPAFSAHGIAGNIGWALAPPVLTAFSLWFGGWRGALIGAAGIGFCALALLAAKRDLLVPAPQASEARERAGPAGAGTAGAGVLLSKPILMCFVFFLLLAAGLIGIQTFGIATLNQLYHLSAELSALTLTSFLIATGAGVLCGGILAARTTQHARVAAAGMASAAALIALVATGVLPHWAVLCALAAAGFCSGITNPSRDLLIRAAAPKGSTGKVYGFVYSGLDAGSAMAPALFGSLLDHGQGGTLLFVVSGLWLLTIASILTLGAARRPP